jgi:hypothetical protein
VSLPQRRCAYTGCGALFTPLQVSRRYCSSDCGGEAREQELRALRAAARATWTRSSSALPNDCRPVKHATITRADDAPLVRNLRCSYYGDCLDEAGRRGWTGFACTECSQGGMK